MRSVNCQRVAVAGWVVLVGVDWIYADVAIRLLADATGSVSLAAVVALLGRVGLWIALAGRCWGCLVRLVMSGRSSSIDMPTVQVGRGAVPVVGVSVGEVVGVV